LGRFGGVGPSGGCAPDQDTRCRLRQLPSFGLLAAMMVPAQRQESP